MAILGPIFEAVNLILDLIDGIRGRSKEPDVQDQEVDEAIGIALDESQPIDEVMEEIVDGFEEFTISRMTREGQLTPDNAEGVADDVEGNAVTTLATLYAAGLALEGASLGQVDTQGEYIVQAMAALGVDDVTGMELEARVAEGLMPALEQDVNQEHRAKKSNFQDWVEFQLRNKDSDTGWLDFRGIDGLRPDQQEHLERAALKNLEPEELIETPVEAGIIPEEETLQNQLDIAGLPEDTKDLFLEVRDNLAQTTRIYEERTVAEELVNQLDQAVRKGEITALEAAEMVPEEIEEAQPALTARWEFLEGLPPKSPSETDIIQMLTGGYRSLSETRERLEQGFLDTDKYEDLLRDEVRKDLDGDLQEAVALGIMSEGRFSDLAEFAGVDDAVIDQLLQGRSFSDITEQRLAEATDPSERSVRTIIGVGEARGSALQASGIETVQDLSEASQEDVAEAAQVSPETAQDFIDAAARRVS